jgi:hypothetical protein
LRVDRRKNGKNYALHRNPREIDYSGSVMLKRIIQSKVVIAREEWDLITGALIMCTTNQPAFGSDPSQLWHLSLI